MKVIENINNNTLFAKVLNSKESIFIFLLLLANFTTKVLYYEYNIKLSFYPSTLIKSILLLAVILQFILLKKKEKIHYYILALTGIFILEMLLHSAYEGAFSIGSRGYYFVKYTFLFFLFPVINALDNTKINKIVNVLLWIAKINVILIVIGFLFQIDVFKSYPYTPRYGYNGILPIQGAGSYFYMFMLSIVYYRYYVEYKVLKKVSKKTYINMLIIVLGSLLVGTKAIFLFILLLFFIDVYFRLKQKVILISSLAIAGIVFFLFCDPIVLAMLKFLNLHESLYTDNSLLTFLTSKRDILFNDAMNYISENWNFVNYFIGGIDFNIIRVEFEIVDVFLFFGIIGMIVYALFFKNVFFKKNQIVYNLILSSVLLISFLSGNLVGSITNSLFFCIVLLYLKKLEKNTADA